MKQVETVAGQRAGRRGVVKGAIATAAGAGAAGYVKPTMQALGVTAAFGQSVSPVEGKCSIDIGFTSAVCDHAANRITGGVSLKNTSSTSGGCPTCQVTRVELYVFEKDQIPPGTGCPEIVGALGGSAAQRGKLENTTGGGNPLVVNSFTPACGVTAQYTFDITYSGTDEQFTLVLLVDVEPSPQHDKVFQTCTTVDCSP